MSLAAISQPERCLLDLPLAALHPILLKAGPLSRELCKSVLHLHGPPTRFTPRGSATFDELLLALTRNHLPQHLSALDITDVDAQITDRDLLALCEALTNLRTLRLPTPPRPDYVYKPMYLLTLAAVSAATSRLPSLTALHAPYLADTELPLVTDLDCLSRWSSLQDLTLPAERDAPTLCTALSCCTALTKLCLELGHRYMDLHLATSLAGQLPALVALELHGCSGHVNAPPQMSQNLARLTRLTLSTRASRQGDDESADQLQRQIGALTNLRSLELRPGWGCERDVVAPNWLTCPTLLSHLRVDLYDGQGAGDGELARALDEVASSVPYLPAQRHLHIADNTDSHDGALSPDACARIASASSCRRRLHLQELWLPAAVAMFTDHVLGGWRMCDVTSAGWGWMCLVVCP